MGISTNTSPARNTLHVCYAGNINNTDYDSYSKSWGGANEKPARAGIRSNTHRAAHSRKDLPEKTHIQAAMSCLEQTQRGSWNNGRKTDKEGYVMHATGV